MVSFFTGYYHRDHSPPPMPPMRPLPEVSDTTLMKLKLEFRTFGAYPHVPPHFFDGTKIVRGTARYNEIVEYLKNGPRVLSSELSEDDVEFWKKFGGQFSNPISKTTQNLFQQIFSPKFGWLVFFDRVYDRVLIVFPKPIFRKTSLTWYIDYGPGLDTFNFVLKDVDDKPEYLFPSESDPLYEIEYYNSTDLSLLQDDLVEPSQYIISFLQNKQYLYNKKRRERRKRRKNRKLHSV
jgi:hypothetical protein